MDTIFTIRHAIEVAWDRGDLDTLQKILRVYRQQRQGKTHKLTIHHCQPLKFK